MLRFHGKSLSATVIGNQEAFADFGWVRIGLRDRAREEGASRPSPARALWTSRKSYYSPMNMPDTSGRYVVVFHKRHSRSVSGIPGD